MKIFFMLLVILLSGCANLDDLNETLNDVTGTPYSAPALAGYPRPSNCNSSNCVALDRLEAQLYDLARAKRITWVRLVDVFYQKRGELYPNTNDNYGTNELRSYQRAIAEQMDLGKITESQWAYLVEKKSGEINSRNQALRNSAPRTTNCTTMNVGTRDFPQFSTTCR